jgi:hypothetical protein
MVAHTHPLKNIDFGRRPKVVAARPPLRGRQLNARPLATDPKTFGWLPFVMYFLGDEFLEPLVLSGHLRLVVDPPIDEDCDDGQNQEDFANREMGHFYMLLKCT